MKNLPSSRKKVLEKAEELLNVKGGILRDMTFITLCGNESAEIDNFKGLVDFSPSTLRINTADNIIRIDGTDLTISHMTDETISIKGKICNLSFE